MSYRLTLAGFRVNELHYASCFVVEVEGHWILITAGHVIEEMRAAIDAGALLHDFNLHDKLAGNDFPFSVPYHFDVEDWAAIDLDGADYAAAPLSMLFTAALMSGGIRPIEENAWGQDPLEQYPYWLLVGIPAETLSESHGRQLLKLTVMPLAPSEPPANAALGQPGRKVFAKLITQPGLDGAIVDDIAGMSGGPVFGLRPNDHRMLYWIIGVQSSWYPSSRVVCFCPALPFLIAIKRAIRVGTADSKG